jgi:hypothetical protein
LVHIQTVLIRELLDQVVQCNTNHIFALCELLRKHKNNSYTVFSLKSRLICMQWCKCNFTRSLTQYLMKMYVTDSAVMTSCPTQTTKTKFWETTWAPLLQQSLLNSSIASYNYPVYDTRLVSQQDKLSFTSISLT